MTTLSGPSLAAAPFTTLVEAFESLDASTQEVLILHRGKERTALTGRAWVALAARWSRALRDAGVAPGDRVLLLLPNDQQFVGAFFGALRLGAVAVPLAWPAGTNAAAALAGLTPLVEKADAKALVTPPGLVTPWSLPVVDAPAAEPLAGVAEVSPSAAAFLQFTSGSLGRPRGAVISHRAAIASAWSMGRAMGVGPSDVGVSWLPLFHDMGLVGALLCPLVHGFPLHLMSPGEFLLHPRRWLDRVHEARGTLAAAPDFAWDLVARRVSADGLDLSCWRWPLSGAEPVHRHTLDAFAERFGPVGFPGIRPVYGLAENTLGVAFSAGDEPDHRSHGRLVPSVGTPLPDMSVAIRGEGEGEILVRGPSLMTGYFRDDEATAATFEDGWLKTGDLGVIEGGRLYVTGREKDLVIQSGRKFHPYDIERVVARLVDAPPNGVAAFSQLDGDREHLVVVCEVRGVPDVDLEKRVRGRLADDLGVRADFVYAVAPGDLPRTTSGKVRRRAVAERFASEIA